MLRTGLAAAKLLLGAAALLWTVAPETALAHGGGGGHGGGGHGGGGHGGGHGGGFHGGGYHGGYGGYGRGGYGGYGLGGYGGYGLGGYGYGLGGYGYGLGGYGYGLGGYGLGGYGYGRGGYGGGYGGYGGGYGSGYGAGYYPYANYSAAPAAPDTSAYVTVEVPPDADVWFNGTKTQQRGATRQFVSPPLEPGYNYQYEIRASWMVDGQAVSQTRTVTVLPGQAVDVNFMQAQNGKRVAPAAP